MDMAALATHQGTVESVGTKQSAGNPNNPVQERTESQHLYHSASVSSCPFSSASVCFCPALPVVSADVVLVALLALHACVFCLSTVAHVACVELVCF